jgi:sulfite reductase alpha subunit-like flavoprotein
MAPMLFFLVKRYLPGDVAVIYPEASEDDVDQFLIHMGWANGADELLEISVRPGGENKFQCPCMAYLYRDISEQPLPANVPPTLTLREAFTRYLDINAVPRRSFFDLLRYFATDELEREKLNEFCTSEGQVSISCSSICSP